MASSSRKTGSKKKRLTLRGSQARRSSQSGGEEERGVERAASSRVSTEDNRTTTQPQPRTDLVCDGDAAEHSLRPSISSPGLPLCSVASPEPSQNLTVTYCYVHSPINCSTRSLSELASVLPSDGATLRSRHMESSPSPPPSPQCSSLPPSSSGPVRKKLRSETDSPHSADIQRLLGLASRLRHTLHDSPTPLPPPLPSSSSPLSSELPLCTHVESGHILINAHHTPARQFSLESSRDAGGCHGNQHPVTSESCEDDEAFWSQAADVVEGRGWEGEEEGGEGDSAFIDDLLSSGLIMTPKAPLTFSPHTSHHSTPHHPSSCTTPLSHRQPESRRTHPHPLF